jgi:hypothetical protein
MFLERKFKKNFIVKGRIGIDNRSTVYLDATLKGMPLLEEDLKNMFEKFAAYA